MGSLVDLEGQLFNTSSILFAYDLFGLLRRDVLVLFTGWCLGGGL